MIKAASFIIILIILVGGTSAFSQKERDFKLVQLSNDIPYDATLLAKAIAKAKSINEVRRIVLKALPVTAGSVKVLYQKGEDFYRWERIFGNTPAESKEKWVLLGSRGLSSLTITSPVQLRQFLHDTLFILDTMALRIRFESEKFILSNYRTSYICHDSTIILSDVLENNSK